jgi:hypothetical protein
MPTLIKSGETVNLGSLINNNLNSKQMATATETPKPSKEQILALCVAVYPHTKSYDRTKEAVREILEISEALYNEQSSIK